MMSVIVTADDFGLNQEIDDAIFGLMSKRIVTAVTMMAHGPTVLRAIEASKHFPSCSFGVHLNLTEVRPLGRHEGLRGLLNENGESNGALDQTPGEFGNPGNFCRQ